MNLKNLDKKLMKKLGIIFGCIICIFLIVIITKLALGNRIDYEKIEDRMIQSAKNYYKEHSEELPTTNSGSVIINTDKLIELKYLKDLSKMTKDKDAICQGEIKVTNNNNYYLYSATLNCGEYYQTKKLTDVLMNDIVANGDGLYQIGDSYVFRGEYVNNYVKFANKIWLILRINNDGTIRMIETTNRASVVWDDRYNSNRNSNVGINDFNVSRIKDTLESIYNNSEEFTEKDKSYISNQNLCIGKRSENNTANDGSIECSNVVENQPLGLLQVNEYALASIDNGCLNVNDPECTNYNYLKQLNSYWTLTADADNTHKVYKISGNPFVSTASNTSRPRIVIHIASNINYSSGDGTKANPYTFK